MLYEPHIECCDPISLKTIQANRFRQMYTSAFDKIPLYRDRLHEVFRGVALDRLDDATLLDGLQRVRPIGKDAYHALDALLLTALDRRIFFIDSSSGSTGSPKSRYCSIQDDLHDTALCTRAFASFGVEPHDRVLTFDLADLTYYTQFTKALQDRGVKNSFYASARADFEGSMRDALAFKPTVLITMPSMLKRSFSVFVDYCKKEGLCRRLIYFGEPLEADLRQLLTEEYHVACYSLYGSTDIGWLAAECEAHAGMHLFADSTLLHLAERTGVTEAQDEGSALFTSLFQGGKPVLRYANGDRISINDTPCSCGRTLPRITVACRDTDLFALLGTKISINEIQHVIYNDEAISCFFQVELTEEGGCTHFIVRLPHHLAAAVDRIIDGLENRIGLAFYTCIDVVAIDLQFVGNDYFTTKKIPRFVDRRGKV